ncbi:MAG: thioredoxin-disulfide reductase [Bacteroidales bacterium]
MSNERVKCLIIGSGPAGYTAAIYASRANLNPVLYEGMQSGGQLTTTTDIDNFPGYPEGTTGDNLMADIRKQVERFDADIRRGEITKVDFSAKPYKVEIDSEKIVEADSIIISTGATAKYLGLESEKKFRGQGVSACATCDGFFYKGKTVAVVGGGDTACEEASYLAGIAKKVYMIVRRNVLRASKAMQNKVFKTENIEILWESNTKEVLGNMMGVNGVLLKKKNGEEYKKDIDGFFLAIGHHPNSEIFKEWIDVDELGYIITLGKTQATNVSGIFAAGDVQDRRYRQAITSAASGCQAALDCEKYLSEN